MLGALRQEVDGDDLAVLQLVVGRVAGLRPCRRLAQLSRPSCALGLADRALVAVRPLGLLGLDPVPSRASIESDDTLDQPP